MFSVLCFVHIASYLLCTASEPNKAYNTDIKFSSKFQFYNSPAHNFCYSQQSECKPTKGNKEKVENKIKMYSSEGNENHELAVVCYDENSLFPHQKANRDFNFAGHEIHITQNWQDMGVAAVVWDAAVVLCEYLEHNPRLVMGRSILELGAGTGLVGMVAALLGGDVIVTERQEAVENLKNIIKENIPDDKQIRAKVLDWTQELSSFDQHYDIVLGADIVYIEETFSHLKKTLLHVCDKATTLLLSCKIRYKRDKTFLAILNDNFIVEEILHDRERDIVIYSGKLK